MPLLYLQLIPLIEAMGSYGFLPWIMVLNLIAIMALRYEEKAEYPERFR